MAALGEPIRVGVGADVLGEIGDFFLRVRVHIKGRGHDRDVDV